MFFKTFAEKQIESKGRDYDDDMRKALRKIALLKAALNELREELEDDFDINENDGPNKAMRLANLIDETLYGPGGSR